MKRSFIAALLFLALALPADDYGIFIREAKLDKRGDLTFLSADVDYRFSPAAIDALEHGIALTLILELTVSRKRAYWFDETVITERRNIELRYHPLAKSFQIADLDSGAVQSFASFSAVTDTLSRIRGWPIQNAESLDSHQMYLARLELTLDVESLPLPLRAEAYIDPNWRLSHPPLEWRLTP